LTLSAGICKNPQIDETWCFRGDFRQWEHLFQVGG